MPRTKYVLNESTKSFKISPNLGILQTTVEIIHIFRVLVFT